MKENFQKVSLRPLREIFILGTAHTRPESQDFLSTLHFLFGPSEEMTS